MSPRIQERADGPAIRQALRPDRIVLGTELQVEDHVHRLHARHDADLGETLEVVGLDGLHMLLHMAQALIAVAPLRLVEGVERPVHRRVADRMDAHRVARLACAQQVGADLGEVHGGHAVGGGVVGIGPGHPSGVVGAYAVDQDLEAVAGDERAGLVVLGLHALDLLDQVLVLAARQLRVVRHAEGQLAVLLELVEDRERVIVGDPFGEDHAHGGEAQALGLLEALAVRGLHVLPFGVEQERGEYVGRRVGKDAGGFAGLVAQDLAAVRVGRVARDARSTQGRRVDREGVHIDLRQHHRAIGDHRVDLRRGGHERSLPVELDDLVAVDPLVVRMRIRPRLERDERLVERVGAPDMHAEVGVVHQSALGEMGVGVVEARHDEAVAELAHLGVGPDEGGEGLLVAACDDLAVRNGDAARERFAHLAREDRVALQDQLCGSHDATPPSSRARSDA